MGEGREGGASVTCTARSRSGSSRAMTASKFRWPKRSGCGCTLLPVMRSSRKPPSYVEPSSNVKTP
eukprot:6419682-Prymnesium_polylepis.1